LQVWKKSLANEVKSEMEEQPVMRMRAFNSDSTCVLMVEETTGKVLDNNAVQPHVHHAFFTFYHIFRNALCTDPAKEKEYKPLQLETELIPEANTERDWAKVVMVSHGIRMLTSLSPAVQQAGRLRLPAVLRGPPVLREVPASQPGTWALLEEPQGMLREDVPPPAPSPSSG
jgi:hypothetical protein